MTIRRSLAIAAAAALLSSSIAVAAPPTYEQNLSCAESALRAEPPSSFLTPVHGHLMLHYVNLARVYAAGYPSLAKMILRSAIQRTDGCVVSGAPDNYVTGPYEMDFVTSCPAQLVPFSCLSAAAAQLP